PEVDVRDLPNPDDIARMAEETIEIGEWTDGLLTALTLLDLDRASSWIEEAKDEGALEERLAPWTAHLERVRKARDDVLALVGRFASSKQSFAVSSDTRLIPSHVRDRAVVALASEKVRF